jgi:hypothetical protein
MMWVSFATEGIKQDGKNVNELSIAQKRTLGFHKRETLHTYSWLLKS